MSKQPISTFLGIAAGLVLASNGSAAIINVPVQSFQSPEPSEGACFGVSVAALDRSAIIGESHNDSGAVDSGAVYVLK